MEKPFRQKCEAGNGRFEATAIIVPGVSWFVRTKHGRTFQFYDERHFKSAWKLVGKPQVIQDDGWSPPPPEYDQAEEERIKEREQLEEEEYQEQVCSYVIRSQDCMNKHGCWVPPSTMFRNRKPGTI